MDDLKLPSKTFCVNPWLHLNIQPSGLVYHCCMSDHNMPLGNVKDNTLEELWNNDRMKQIRKEMVDGIETKACSKCYHIEDTGISSPRTTNNFNFKKDLPTILNNTDLETGHNNDFTIKYWDIRWSNICNFKCRMCGVFSSNKWAEDAEALHGTITSEPGGIISFEKDSKSDIMEYVDRSIMDVEEIYFAGGEPLIMDEHYQILEKLIAAGRTDVRLRYNTNFSHLKFKKWDLMGLWKPFLEDPKGNVKLAASLDAVGKLAEVSRNGTNWSKVEQNVKFCVENGVSVYIAPTISIMNVFYIHELVDFAIKFDIPASSISFNNILVVPHYYDIRILPKNLQEEAKKRLTEYMVNCTHPEYVKVLEEGYNAWCNHLNTPFEDNRTYYEEELVVKTEILDIRRSEKLLDVNPEYKEWFAKIKKRNTGEKWDKVI